MSRHKTLMVIDGNALLHRAWHALPPTIKTSKGEIVNAVYGVTLAFLKAVKDHAPDYVIATFDERGPTFRDQMYAEYKAQREKKPDELYEQIPRIKEVIRAFGVPVITHKGVEADDVIGTIARVMKSQTDVMIVTGDLDTLQLVDEHVSVYTFKQGVREMMRYDEESVKARFGLKPNQMIEYKALRGDASDNIPGVKGIGEKGALALLQTFATIKNIYDFLEKNLDQDSRASKGISVSLGNKLLDHKQDAFLSHTLATIKCDLPIQIDLATAEWGRFDREKVVELFRELEFQSLLDDIPPLGGAVPHAVAGVQQRALAEDSHRYHLISTQNEKKEFFTLLSRQKISAFDTETESLDRFHTRVIGISFCWKAGEAYYMEFIKDRPEEYQELVYWLEDKKNKKIAHNAKFDMTVLGNHGINVAGVDFDTMIASYVLCPDARSYSLDNVTFVECGHQMIPITNLIGTGKKQTSMLDAPLDQVKEYAAEDADYTWRLYEIFQPKLKANNLESVFQEIDMPLVSVLVDMERTGIKVHKEFLDEISKELGKRLKSLEHKIYTAAGVEFNINSPQQLGKVLYEKLELSTRKVKRKKTGFSTAAAELDKLQGEHPVIDFLLEYRELSKLKSTYADALPELIDTQDGRLHTDYSQTIAATGRLASSNPNLQNIPIKTDLGREIRKAFVAERGNVLLSVDYSQIELRIVAHMANDRHMIKIFNEGRDIHTATAATINGVDIHNVTQDMRRRAKEVNFGVLYGMGWMGLSQRTGISKQEAQNFIEGYFATFPQVAEFIEETKSLARKLGYVETLFGRRRYLPEINSQAPQFIAMAERMAVNTPIQGTAADIMKKAMANIHNVLPKDVKMILQVHDELVFEVPQDMVDEISKVIKEEMESVEKLRVPIVAEIKVGRSWGEMQEIK